MNEHQCERPVWPFDIAIVGTGIVGGHQLTREAENAIRRSKRTFVIESGYGMREYIATLCPETRSLRSLYEPGKSRLATYRRMAATVISAALTETPVCLAVYGHPWVACYPTTLICRAAPLLNLHVEVFAGISSFDTMLVDLGTDIGIGGVQMYEATDLLLRRRPIQNDVTCIILQAANVGDPTYPEHDYGLEQFKPLEEYLLRFYRGDHEITLIMTKTFPLLRSTVQRFPLNELAAELTHAPQVGTLYIPPASGRPIVDDALMNRMMTLEATTRTTLPTPKRPGRPVIGPQPT
jgi:uncharacterized protein YabN with tetrapyrrole methylase and pyrophosphatase domain